MYRMAYNMETGLAPMGSRQIERDAIGRSIELMEEAEKLGLASREALVAINYLCSLWSILVEDLARNDALPPLLRAQLISIGISIFRQADDVRTARQTSFGSLIDVSRLILEGLQ